MARVSRKAALAQTGNSCLAAAPEKVYHVAAYVRLSVEDNGRVGDKESCCVWRRSSEISIISIHS